MDPVSVWKDGLGGTVGYLNYAGLTADDWQVVQRAPREWLVCPGCGVASVQGRLVRGHLPHACHEKAIRVREVVE
jgi:hypothetical protein